MRPFGRQPWPFYISSVAREHQLGSMLPTGPSGGRQLLDDVMTGCQLFQETANLEGAHPRRDHPTPLAPLHHPTFHIPGGFCVAASEKEAGVSAG